jgi:hypothetical protein
LTDVRWYGTLKYITTALSFSFSGEAISCVHVYELDSLQGDKNDHVNTFRQFTALSAISATTWLCFYPGTVDYAVLFADSVNGRLHTPSPHYGKDNSRLFLVVQIIAFYLSTFMDLMVSAHSFSSIPKVKPTV